MNTEPFYMSPAMRAERVKVEVPSNGYSGEMSPEALGIVCSLFVLNGLCWKYPDSTKYNKMFYDLRHWALEKHPEALEICGAID